MSSAIRGGPIEPSYLFPDEAEIAQFVLGPKRAKAWPGLQVPPGTEIPIEFAIPIDAPGGHTLTVSVASRQVGVILHKVGDL